ncbi:MAG: hypothetical protein ACRDK2_02300, partial [Solirubrobacteraceae bacterium]
LSAMFVKFRDIQPIWAVVSQIVFYGSPVIIPLEKVREKLLHIRLTKVITDGKVHYVSEYFEHPTSTFHHILYHVYMLNPLVGVFQQFRHAMVTHATLSVGEALGGWIALLEPLVVVVAVFALGFWVFNRSAPSVAENL